MPRLRNNVRRLLLDLDLAEHVGSDTADVVARLYRLFKVQHEDIEFSAFSIALDALGYSARPIAFVLKRKKT